MTVSLQTTLTVLLSSVPIIVLAIPPHFLNNSTGYGYYIVTRPLLYDLILRQVPPEKLHFGKRVNIISDQGDKVIIETSDNATHEGDILVGADGAHSSVRQHLYATLKAKGELPKSDQEDLPFSCTCLVGQTKSLDPEEFPVMKEPVCQFQIVLGKDKPYTVS